MKHKEVSTSFLFCVLVTFWFVFTNSTFLRAETLLIGVDASSPSRLIRIDKNTGQGTKIESLPVRHVTDIAFSKDGVLYGVTFDMFFKYDRETRSFDKIFSTSSNSCLNSLDFGPNNSLYIADCLFGELLKFDISTTKLSVIGLFEDGYLCSGGLAFSPSGALYATGKRDQFDPEELLEIDVQTGSARSIGFIGFQDVYGLAFDEDGSLYGAANGERGDVPILIKIDTTTGKGHRVGEVTNANGMYGLATLVSGKPSGDDYPPEYKNISCDCSCCCPSDRWRFDIKNCTSFVAWRMNRDREEGSFTNYMSYNGKKGHWGNALNWRNNAEYLRAVQVELSRQLKFKFFFLEPFVVFFISF